MWPRVMFHLPDPEALLEGSRSPRPMTWGTSRHGLERLRAVRMRMRKKQALRKRTARRGRSMDGVFYFINYLSVRLALCRMLSHCSQWCLWGAGVVRRGIGARLLPGGSLHSTNITISSLPSGVFGRGCKGEMKGSKEKTSMRVRDRSLYLDHWP